jgi:hypothetical protein
MRARLVAKLPDRSARLREAIAIEVLSFLKEREEYVF